MSTRLSESSIRRLVLPTPFPVGPVNAYLVRRDPLTLVDTGPLTEDAYARLVAQLREHGVEVADLEVILITHGHQDHMGLLGRLLEESAAAAFAHPLVVHRTRDFEQAHRDNLAFHLAVMRELGVPEAVLAMQKALQKEVVAYGAPAEIRHAVEDGGDAAGFSTYFVPGHSPSDTLFVDHDARLAFLGDHVLKGINPNPLLRRPRAGEPRPKSLVEYVTSLRKTRALELDVCFPGHNSAFSNYREIIDGLLTRIEDRSRRVRQMLSDGPLTPYDVCRTLFPSLDGPNLFLGMSVAAGHLELLEDRGLAVCAEVAGVMTYAAT